jgi:hypothetical protein
MKNFLAVIALFASSLVAAQQTPARKAPLVLIQGSGNVNVSAGAVGGGLIAAGAGSVSKHDQTMEMAQQLLKRCPEIALTLGADQKPDYMLLLNREGGGFFDSGESQIMLVRGSDKMVLYASKQTTVKKAMKDGCRAIIADWKQQLPSPANAADTAAKQQDPGVRNWWGIEKKQPSQK